MSEKKEAFDRQTQSGKKSVADFPSLFLLPRQGGYSPGGTDLPAEGAVELAVAGSRFDHGTEHAVEAGFENGRLQNIADADLHALPAAHTALYEITLGKRPRRPDQERIRIVGGNQILLHQREGAADAGRQQKASPPQGYSRRAPPAAAEPKSNNPAGTLPHTLIAEIAARHIDPPGLIYGTHAADSAAQPA